MNYNQMTKTLSSSRIIELVQFLGAEDYLERDDVIIFNTICHNIDGGSLKLYYYKNSKLFYCYTDCDCAFNIISLFKKRYDLLGKTYSYYNDIIKIVFKDIQLNPIDKDEIYHSNYVEYEAKRDVEVEYNIIPKTILNTFSKHYPCEWLQEGISPTTLELFNIRYSISQNKIIIPHYDKDSNLIGIRGRALNEDDIKEGKYKPYANLGTLYNHSLGHNLYGLNLNKDNIKKLGIAIVAEGEKSVMLSEEFLGRDKNVCVATCGSTFHLYQVKMLIAAGAKHIILAFDKEGKDWKEKQNYFNKLNNICKKYQSFCQMSFIYDNKNLLTLKQSPFDMGKEVFNKLLKGAIKL